MGIGKRLQELTADLGHPPPESLSEVSADSGEAAEPVQGREVETRFPPVLPGRTMPKTGPGQMLAFRADMLAAEAEMAQIRTRLREYEGSMPTRKLDPKTIVPSRWANRHPASYSTPAYVRLKADIEHAGGNVQPILVRSLDNSPGTYEIVFGHRRHQACKDLGLGVLASIWTDALADAELFATMDRENRERADLTPYEQGVMYQRALEENLYPSQRRLAEALGVSHTWVRKALAVAELPQPLTECFRSPLEIQHRHAEQITAALEKNRKLVLKRAEKLRGQNLSANEVVMQLTDARASNEHQMATEIRSASGVVGQWSRDKNGTLVIKLKADAVPQDRLDPLMDAITRALS